MVREIQFKEDDGSITLWRYDSKVTTHGPVEVIQDYKPGDNMRVFTVVPKKGEKPPARGRKAKAVPTEPEPEPAMEEKGLPKTKQRYLNPETGKMVGYVRAKNLGII